MDEELRQAEVGVLGAALLEPDRVLGVLSRWGCQPDWFGSDAGQAIAGALWKLHADGVPVDLITVGDELRRTGRGALSEQLRLCFEAVPTAAHAEHYVGMLRDGWMARAARAALTEMSTGFEAREKLPKDVVAAAIGRLTALVEACSRGQARTAWEVKRDQVELWKDAAEGKRSALGLPWPYASMNALTSGIYPGVTVVAARPSVGKSMFEGTLVRHLLMQGKRVARASLDMGVEPLVSRDLCAMSGESMNRMRKGFMTASDREKMELTLEAMRDWREEVIEERTSEGIVARARAMAANGGLDLLTLDYAQLVDTGASRDNDNVRIAKAMARVKEFSLTTGVPAVVLSQLSRLVEKEERRPQLSDLRDSGAIEQDAAAVVFLYMEPKVGKNWCELADAGDPKQLAVRPVVWDLLKNQQGAVGSVGLRQHARWFMVEQARMLGETEKGGDDCSYGWDFGVAQTPDPSDPDLNTHVVARHPKGAVEVFSAAWFREVNRAARKLGRQEYAEARRVTGILEAVRLMEEERKAGHR